MSGVHALVFAHDRAMQLDAFLRSAHEHAPYDSITVLMHNWSPDHEPSGHRCEQEHPEAWFARTRELEPFVRHFLAQHPRVVFHTDDDVFYRPFVAYDIGGAWSGRLGLNTGYCHPLARTQQIPAAFPWRWREANGDFGYPLSINATIYRSADLRPLLDFHFATPTELESGLADRAHRFAPEWMMAPLHSCCVSLPHNVVSPSSTCPRGLNPDWQPDALCVRYVDGWRVDLDAMDFAEIVGAHQEVPLEFARVETGSLTTVT